MTVANEIAYTGFCVTWQDFEKSISQLKSSHASSIGAPKVLEFAVFFPH